MSELGKLSNYDNDPADASLVEAWLRIKEDQRYADMADKQKTNPVVKLLIVLALGLIIVIVFTVIAH